MSLRIGPGHLDAIRDAGRRAYPEECCGLLLGTTGDVSKSVADLRPVGNAREDSPRNRYLIEPRDLLEVEGEARRRGLDIIGVYHSHPDHPARPSEFDREHAFPWYSYIIVSIEQGEPKDVTSWVLKDDRSTFDPEPLLNSES